MSVQKIRSTKYFAIPAFCLLLCVLAPGCGRLPEGKTPARDAPTTVNTAELPTLGDPIPLLDEGRIEVSPPQGWSVPPRSNKYLARFQQNPDSPYPTILVTAEDCVFFSDVSAENVTDLADWVASANSLAAVKPVEIGPFVGVAYRKQGIEKDSINKILDRLFLETVVGGRKYTFELRTREGSLPETQPYLLAVARGVRFLKAKPSEKPGKDELDLENLNLEELLK